TGTGASNHGIYLQGAHVRNAAVGGGDINLTGYGGGSGGSGASNHGIMLNTAARITTLDGNINLSGNYGLGLPVTDATGNNHGGVYINGGSIITTDGTGDIN